MHSHFTHAESPNRSLPHDTNVNSATNPRREAESREAESTGQLPACTVNDKHPTTRAPQPSLRHNASLTSRLLARISQSGARRDHVFTTRRSRVPLYCIVSELCHAFRQTYDVCLFSSPQLHGLSNRNIFRNVTRMTAKDPARRQERALPIEHEELGTTFTMRGKQQCLDGSRWQNQWIISA